MFFNSIKCEMSSMDMTAKCISSWYRNLTDSNFIHEKCKRAKELINTPIYKVIPYKYALPIILDNKIRMDAVRKWDDKYELFILRANLIADTTKGLKPIDVEPKMLKNTFGQCWSFNGEMEAAWRLYGKDSLCVRLSTTVGKLAKLVYSVQNKQNEPTLKVFWIGSVKYVTDVHEWVEGFQPDLETKPNCFRDIFTNSLFVKRKPYEYENEMRVVCYADNFSDDYVEIQDDSVTDLIDTVEFSPLLSEVEYDINRSYLESEIKKKGLSIEVSRSNVYFDSSNDTIVI